MSHRVTDLKGLAMIELRRLSKQFRENLKQDQPFDPVWLIVTDTGEIFETITPVEDDTAIPKLFARMAPELIKRNAVAYVFTFEGSMYKAEPSGELGPEEGILTSVAAEIDGGSAQAYRVIHDRSLGPCHTMDNVDPPVKPLGWHRASSTVIH